MDPEPSRWTEEGTTYWAKTTDYSNEAQGITTDNNFWYLSTYAEDHKSIRKINNAGKIVSVPGVPWDNDEVHRHVTRAGSISQFKNLDTVDNCLSMAAVNPLNGKLYTARFDIQNTSPPTLYDYDWNTMKRNVEDDILLGRTPLPFANTHGAVILVASDEKVYDYDNYLFVFSARTIYIFWHDKLGDLGRLDLRPNPS
ncbi:hypothetical protein B0O99DRAFT_685218 [Bisporella sp. PMI_857]|nr:hypothetical protein B0O99DRAFT_685218 [Bisporella sp. PMI_857]